jgi:hypothetical protein
MQFYLRTAAAVISVLFLAHDSYASNVSAAGTWSGSINCGYGSGSLEIIISGSGTVSGSVTNGTIFEGRVSGGSLSFSTRNWMGNIARFSGNLGGNSLSGTYKQTANSEECRFQASRVAGPTASPEKPITPAREQTQNRPAKQAKDDPRACRTVIETAAELEQLSRKDKQFGPCDLGRRTVSERINRLSSSIRGANCPSKMVEIDRALKGRGMTCQQYYHMKNAPSGDGGVRG